MHKRVYVRGEALDTPLLDVLKRANVSSAQVKWVFTLGYDDPDETPLPDDGSEVRVEEEEDAIYFIGLEAT